MPSKTGFRQFAGCMERSTGETKKQERCSLVTMHKEMKLHGNKSLLQILLKKWDEENECQQQKS